MNARGLGDRASREAFLRPTLAQLHDPGDLPDIDKAAERLLRALRDADRIAIFGDYDVDGITASALLWHVFRAIRPDAEIGVHLPHRVREGYGPNTPAMRALADAGASVIVTVDCGGAASGPIAALRESHPEVDVIVTDHHALPGGGADADLPPAFAVVHPGRASSGYPFADLCGAGVAFKLAWRLATLDAGTERVHPEMRSLLLDLLGLVATGTVADVVPMIDENRAICACGLAQLARSRFPGIRALLGVGGRRDAPIDAARVGFDLGPRLNACGRLGDAMDGFRLLTTADASEARSIAERLDAMNTERRAVEKAIVAEAEATVERDGLASPDRSAIVLAGDGWHPGVIGIACSRLVERYHRPVILLCDRGDGVLTGSGRSVDGFDLHKGLEGCAEHLVSAGGHPMAAGLKLQTERLAGFVDAFLALAGASLGPGDLSPSHRYDCDAGLGDLRPSVVEALDLLGPFGRANPRPVFRIGGLRLAAHPELLGRDGAHLSLRLADADGRGIRALAWRHGSSIERLSLGQRVEILATPRINAWRGSKRVELELRCIAEAGVDPVGAVVTNKHQAPGGLASV